MMTNEQMNVEIALALGYTAELTNMKKHVVDPYEMTVYDPQHRPIHSAWWTEPDNLRECLAHLLQIGKLPRWGNSLDDALGLIDADCYVDLHKCREDLKLWVAEVLYWTGEPDMTPAHAVCNAFLKMRKEEAK